MYNKKNPFHPYFHFLFLLSISFLYLFVLLPCQLIPNLITNIQQLTTITIATAAEAQPVQVESEPHLIDAQILSPENFSIASGSIFISVTVIDPSFPLEKYEVEYYIDSKMQAKMYLLDSPYEWDTTKYSNGLHFIVINVCDGTGYRGVGVAFVYVKNKIVNQ